MESTRHQFVFDQNRCVGCHACVVACNCPNGTDIAWRAVSSVNAVQEPDLALFHLSLACNHCDTAICMQNCPAKAYSRHPETGAVLLNTKACIGCKYCTWVCPFDAPKYNAKHGITEKCTFCVSGESKEISPACARLCPTGALAFEAKVEVTSSSNSNFHDFDLHPSLRLIPLREQHARGPKQDSQFAVRHTTTKKEMQKIDPVHEWPLVLFTSGVPLLVAALIAGVSFGSMLLDLFAFVGAASFLGVVSALHLGRKERIYRAIFHFSSSWLSREIVFFGAFVASGVLYLLLSHSFLLVMAGVSGIACVLSIDMLYQIIPKQKSLAHPYSASVLLVLFFAVCSSNVNLFAGVAVVQSILIVRTLHKNKQLLVPHIFICCGIASFFFPTSFLLFVFAVIAALIGRFLFYGQLNIRTPQKELNSE